MFIPILTKNKKIEPPQPPDPPIPDKEPLLCITFDDGNMSDVEIAYPYLKEKGLTASFMVVTNWVENPNPIGGIWPRSSGQWDLYRQAHADGFSVQCHTHTHRKLTTITHQEIHEEMQNVNYTFLANNLPMPEHHTFPAYDHDNDVIDIIMQYRKTVMRTGFGRVDYDDSPVDRYLKAPVTEINSIERLNTNKEAVLKAIQDGVILITTQHRISEDGSGGSVTALWKDWIDFVVSTGIKCVTINTVHSKLKEYKGIL